MKQGAAQFHPQIDFTSRQKYLVHSMVISESGRFKHGLDETDTLTSASLEDVDAWWQL
jgi:hypothetical protein